MPTPELEILFPSRELKVGDEIITVRELPHSEAVKFLSLLGKFIPQIYDTGGAVNLTAGGLGALVAGTEELSNFLIQKSTGISPAKLPLSVSLEVLGLALELNLSEEIIAKGKKLAGLFQALVGRSGGARQPAPGSAKSTISSAKEATTSEAN